MTWPEQSALAKKSMMVLRDLLGDDQDKEQLFAAALAAVLQSVCGLAASVEGTRLVIGGKSADITKPAQVSEFLFQQLKTEPSAPPAAPEIPFFSFSRRNI